MIRSVKERIIITADLINKIDQNTQKNTIRLFIGAGSTLNKTHCGKNKENVNEPISVTLTATNI
ncbi:hypothetical protein GCM10011350_19830 [Marinomonas arctica]|nr:hypothetical protein GCM10011350_19830 [Marinomonas arctica]